jgi:tRNA(adenine34) deaminase
MKIIKQLWLAVTLIVAASLLLLISDWGQRVGGEKAAKTKFPQIAIMQITSTPLLDSHVAGVLDRLESEGLVQDGRVVARGARTGTRRTSAGRSFANRAIISEVDHAEIRALKQLEQSRQPVMPENCTLFCTMEPCLMCFAAILLSGIKTIVYAFEDPMGGGTGCDLTTLPPLYRNSRIRMVAGICRQKSLDLFFKFFNKGTSPYWKGSFLDRYVRDQMQKTE